MIHHILKCQKLLLDLSHFFTKVQVLALDLLQLSNAFRWLILFRGNSLVYSSLFKKKTLSFFMVFGIQIDRALLSNIHE